jgi:hypothetical protein
MVRPSFVPPPEIRELREITRYRKTQVDARAREIQRLAIVSWLARDDATYDQLSDGISALAA